MIKLILCLSFGFAPFFLLRERKAICTELEQRHLDGTNVPYLKSTKTRMARNFAFILAGLMLMAVIGGLGLGLAITSKDKEGCRNCGRDVPLVAGFGFCEDCYEGFVD